MRPADAPPRPLAATLCLAALCALAAPAARAVPPYVADPGAWHQLSYPADAAGRPLRELFAPALAAADYGRTWQVYTFDARSGSYADPGLDGALDEGQGFWFIQTTGRAVDLGAADLPYALGEPSRACAVPEGCRASALSGPAGGVGWNLVGHPFEGPVAADALRLVTRASGSDCRGDGCALDASPADVVGGVRLWAYDPGSGTYVDRAADALEPWTGVWFRLEPGARAARPSLLYPDPFCA